MTHHSPRASTNTPLVDLYAFEKRTVTIDGKQSSVALEHGFWMALKEIARRRGRPWQEELRVALSKKRPDYNSRAGWLRIHLCAEIVQIVKQRSRPAKT